MEREPNGLGQVFWKGLDNVREKRKGTRLAGTLPSVLQNALAVERSGNNSREAFANARNAPHTFSQQPIGQLA